jgi:DNA-binding transcriptional MerR regulator
MRIGDFARLGNVSVRTVRFYDEAGLLPPLHIDCATGYRRYGPEQIARLQEIRAYQDLGFSLAQIRQLLKQELSTGHLRDLLRQRQSELKRHIRDDAERLTRVEQQLQDLESAKSVPSPVVLRQTEDRWVISLRQKLRRYEDAQNLFDRLESQISHRCMTRERTVLWHACGPPGSTIDCEAVRYLTHSVTAPKGLRTYHLPSAMIASVFHSGGEATELKSYGQLNQWLGESGFRLHGAKREIYWVESNTEPLTEIQYPLLRSSTRKTRAA